MSGPSSVTLAVQALSRKQTRIEVLEQQIKKLESGDPSAMSMIQVLPDVEYQQAENQSILSESQVVEKLNEFNYDLNSFSFAIVYQQLHACSARALDRRAYESSKLIRADLDKLKGQIHSQNPEISEAAKKRRVIVQEELRGLGEQQQRSSKEWTNLVRTTQLVRRGKALETDSDFDLLCIACEAWYEQLQKQEQDRCDQMIQSCAAAVKNICQGIHSTRAVQGYSRVVAADNTLASQRKTAFALAEQAVVQASPTEERKEVAPVSMASPESCELTTARVAHARYAQQEQCRKYESSSSSLLPLGATVHCLGRLGVVVFIGHCVLGDGIWVLIRLANSHGGEHPLIYTDGLVPLNVNTEIKALLRCAPEHAQFAPAHAVHIATERMKFKVTRTVQHAAVVIQTGLRKFQKKKHLVEMSLKLQGEPKFRAADAIARAVGMKSVHVQEISNCFRATSIPLCLYLRARIAYVWIIHNLKYLWYSEEQDVETILRDRGGNALGLNFVYREQLQALGVDCCLVKGVHRLVGVDTVTGQSSPADNHVWAIVRVDRGRDGRVSADSDRYIIVDVASSIGQWRGLRFESNPTASFFDIDVDVFSAVTYPSATLPSIRATAALHLFSATPTNTLTHQDPQPRPLVWGRYDVETALITRPKFYEAQGHIQYPKQPNCSVYTTSRAYFCTSMLLHKDVEVDAMLVAVTSPFTSPSAPNFKRVSTRATGSHCLIQYAPAPVQADTHRLVYVTVVFGHAGAYSLDIYNKSVYPAGVLPSLKLVSIPIITSMGVYNVRSTETVVAGYLCPQPLPPQYSQLSLVAPTQGYVDQSVPLHFELIEEASDILIQDVVAAVGDEWVHQRKMAVAGTANAPDTPVSVFKGTLTAHTTTSCRIVIYARFADGLAYMPVFARKAKNLAAPTLRFDHSNGGFSTGLKFFNAHVTPTSVLVAVSTHAPRCLHTQLVRGKHSKPPKDPVFAGKCTTKFVPIDLLSQAKTLSESVSETEFEGLRQTVASALLKASNDPTSYQQSNPVQDLLWLSSCSLQELREGDSDCTVLLYSSIKPGGVMNFVAAQPLVIPEKQVQ